LEVTDSGLFHMQCLEMDLREEQPRPLGAEKPDDRPKSAAGPKTEPAILCRACGFVVTTARHRMAVQGTHEHRFMNPAGFLYHIGCFAEAVGCVTVGPASHEYPWFPGFAWRLALCGGCRGHLGWHFRGEDGVGFFGLILDRLHEGDGA
jgi:hypothetical protein